MSAAQPGAWKRQDGQLITRLHTNGPAHAQRRWDERVASEAGRPDLVGHPVRVAWREGEPAGSGRSWAQRAHPTGLVLVSVWGSLTTVYYDEQYRSLTVSYRDKEFTKR